jgi:septum site-determining protein MinC
MRGAGDVREAGVTLRTTRDKVLVFVAEESDFDSLLTRLKVKMGDAIHFPRRAEVIVDVGRRVLSEQQLLDLQRTIQEDPRLRLVSVVDSIDMASKPGWWPESPDDMVLDSESAPAAGEAAREDAEMVRPGTAREASTAGEYTVRTTGAPDEAVPNLKEARRQRRREDFADAQSHPLEEGIVAEANACLVKATVRSGQSVWFDGDIVVLGDVNAGAEVIASGDIVIVGTLRGTVHAGCRGNPGSTVTALRLEPTQLRVGEYAARPPDGERHTSRGPETARVRDGVVMIERLQRYAPPRREGGET